MDKPRLNSKSRFHQGKYRPKFPQKYLGNPTNIVYRSSWEKYFLQWCDLTPYVVRYGSEELIIPYISPIDGKVHRYYIDFVILVKQPNGTVKKFAVEIKPYSQTKKPRINSRNILSESTKYKVNTYLVNEAKWMYAREYCKKLNMEFLILTEKELLKGK